ncbi:unnamed protein product [Acanthoscelides obtectus]|uniref:Uncharacterized protein n=1 Tax=Acanthoscelides obtectus TaxID=200917 RepID=A0A9P0L6G8_ACAOB|nr:unnamed protein product [Acanthoscelides obtectus]CAK1652889.1 hypothetical protein AOBTE_LOCUS17958 [Acanthoscelides obtectus]
MATFTPHTEKGRKELKETYFSAVNQGNLHLVTECLRRGQDPNSILDDSAALHIAAEKGDIGLGYILTADERTNVDIRMPSNRRIADCYRCNGENTARRGRGTQAL